MEATLIVLAVVQEMQTSATLLRSATGWWNKDEISALKNELSCRVNSHPHYPAYLIIDGHHENDLVSKALGGKKNFTLTAITDPDELPFTPPDSEVINN